MQEGLCKHLNLEELLLSQALVLRMQLHLSLEELGKANHQLLELSPDKILEQVEVASTLEEEWELNSQHLLEEQANLAKLTQASEDSLVVEQGEQD